MKQEAKRRAPSEAGLVYLVRGRDAGRAAWHYVLVDRLKLPLFTKMLKKGVLDLKDFGTVLHSGWGEEPPAALAEAVKRKYS